MPTTSPANETAARHDEFVALVEAHQRPLMKVCWSYTRTPHDRDDLFQEIAAQLWTAFPSYDSTRPFGTWMVRIALNVAIDHHRRRQRRRALTTAVSLDPTMDPPHAASDDKHEQLDELRELLDRQSAPDRALLLLTLEGHSYREIAEIMGISETNVGTRLNRLKTSLRASVQSSPS